MRQTMKVKNSTLLHFHHTVRPPLKTNVMQTKTPCLGCPDSRNQLNGVYCKILKRYVEHCRIKPCQQNNELKT